MADTELSTDPQDYITGPTRDNVDLKNGGTNRSGGVSTSGEVTTTGKRAAEK